jgi:hypothetical protein
MESASSARNTEEAPESTLSPPPGDSVLLLSSRMARRDACLVDDGAPLADSNVLAVTLNGDTDDVTDEFFRCVGRLPDRLAVVAVGENARAPSNTDEGLAAEHGEVSTASVSSPGDLTGLGIKLSQCLSTWDDNPNRTTVRFDSLTTLLQFAELKRVFRFVHVLLGRIDSANAVGYFHLDPAAHDDQTLATLRGLFDAVYELEDGEWVEA